MVPNVSLNAYLEAQQTRVERLLRRELEALRDRVPPRLFEAMAYSLYDGGKRLRPVLCLAFAEAVSPEAPSAASVERAELAACALEYVHTYSLIHDDLPAMDDDDLRRGRPTNHRAFGEAMAILAGDGLLTEAFSLVARTQDAALVAELAAAAGATGMIAGQVLDIDDERPGAQGYLERMHGLKTGRLIQAACRMGVRAGGGGAAALAAADAYGAAVGLAFQIADDVLDATASQEALGKPVRADAAAKRHTFASVLGVEQSRALASAQVERAIAAVSSLERGRGVLEALARFAVERSH